MPGKWHKKLTVHEKKARRKRSKRKRQLCEPTREELNSESKVHAYCDKRMLNVRVRSCLLDILKNKDVQKIDHRDLRQVPPEDRVPRSLQMPSTPPQYWKVAF